MLTIYKWVVCIAGFAVSALLMSIAFRNLGQVKKKHYTNFGAPICVVMVIMSIAISVMAGYFLSM
ncbi:MAG: hypothetical protein IJJ34_08835 [Clostridia bacterium]|nr:hypothetical protein [Clostridia bacterium]